MRKKKKKIVSKMFSMRLEQFDRFEKLAKKENRNLRVVFGQMLDLYEKKEKKK